MPDEKNIVKDLEELLDAIYNADVHGDDYKILDSTVKGLIKKCHATPTVEPVNGYLFEFAKECIRQICWDQDYDGGSLQELAEEMGIIKGRPVTQEDIDKERMSNPYDYEVGDTCYFFTDAYKQQPTVEELVEEVVRETGEDVRIWWEVEADQCATTRWVVSTYEWSLASTSLRTALTELLEKVKNG